MAPLFSGCNLRWGDVAEDKKQRPGESVPQDAELVVIYAVVVCLAKFLPAVESGP